jgi:hypothetical protein
MDVGLQRLQGARCAQQGLDAGENDAKAALIPYARELYSIVKFSPTASNENKTLIGIHIDDAEPSPEPPPALPPALTIVSVIGRTVRCKIVDSSTPNARRRAINAKGATVLSYVGTTPPPASDPGWKLEGQTGKTTFNVQFPDDVAFGTPCWVIALWYNARGQYSPACQPVQTFLLTGTVAQAA